MHESRDEETRMRDRNPRYRHHLLLVVLARERDREWAERGEKKADEEERVEIRDSGEGVQGSERGER